MHEDEEICYVLDGSVYFDLRETSSGPDSDEEWIRVHATPVNIFAVL